MAVEQVWALILVSFIVPASTTDDGPATCYIPEGHYNGEPIGYYDPEPREGYIQRSTHYCDERRFFLFCNYS